MLTVDNIDLALQVCDAINVPVLVIGRNNDLRPKKSQINGKRNIV